MMTQEKVRLWSDPEIAMSWIYHAHNQSERDGANQRDLVLLPRLYDHIGQPHGQFIADFGCGSSEYLGFFPRDNNLFVMDINYGLVAASKEPKDQPRYLAQVDLTQGIPLASGSVDLGISNLVLMWIRDYETAIRQMARTIKPGGDLIVTITHPSYANGRINIDEHGIFMKLRPIPTEAPVIKAVNKGAVGPFYTYRRHPQDYMHIFYKYGMRLKSDSPNFGYEEIMFPSEFPSTPETQQEYILKQTIPVWLLLHLQKTRDSGISE